MIRQNLLPQSSQKNPAQGAKKNSYVMRTCLPFKNLRRRERGYVLLSMMLFVAILTIMAAVAAPEIAFQVRRDREEELIHRGVQYSRAIRRYVKKFGRYPTRIEELENTNNIRFIRKRYKDPITNKDFKLLHVGEVQLMGGAGGMGLAASALPGVVPPNSDPNSSPTTEKDKATTPDAEKKGSIQVEPNPTSGLSGQVFGGGPIVGVASTSKASTIREFNNKNHYNLWQFIYDPATDRGGMLNTPSQPPLQGAVPNPVTPGATTTPPGSSIGQPAATPPPAQTNNPEPPLTPQQ